MSNLKTLKCLHNIVQKNLSVVPLKIKRLKNTTPRIFVLIKTCSSWSRRFTPAGQHLLLPHQCNLLFPEATENFLED